MSETLGLPGLARRDLYDMETVLCEIEAPAARVTFWVECLHTVGGKPCYNAGYVTASLARADEHAAWQAHSVRILRREEPPMPTDQSSPELAALAERRRNGTVSYPPREGWPGPTAAQRRPPSEAP